MTSVTDTSSANSAQILAALNQKNAATSATTTTGSTTKESALGQDAFLKLLITQLKNQNPLSPQDNTAFVAQLAQFSSLQGIQNLNTTMTSVASGMQSSQALQASSLVGRTVETKTDTAYLSAGSYVRGTLSLDNSTADLQLKIYDSTDKLVMQSDLGAQAVGEQPFVWDGKDSSGTALTAGTYKFVVTANDSGKSTAVTTYLANNVNSVTMGANQAVTLNVNAVGQVALSDIKDIL